MPASLSITTATLADLARMVDWAALEGWNPGLADAPVFLATDPGGFLIGRLGPDPVSAISVVAYGSGFGFLGFYICRPEFRGKGYGFAVWEAGMKRLGDRVIGLDGVVDQQSNYRKQGFVLAHRNVRYGGIAGAPSPRDPHVVQPAGDLAEAVIAYDRAFFAGPREVFTRRWIQRPQTALAYVKDGQVQGYGVIRPSLDGHKIGPLFADTEAIAEILFDALSGTVAGQPIVIDPPLPNTRAVALAERHGLTPGFETARMYRGPAPDLPLDKTFGITTFELG